MSVPTEKPAQQQRLPLESRPLIHPEATVWRVLDRDHRGRERAIKMPDLADKVGLKTRALQGLIRHLRMEHGKPIGSSCREPYGYFRMIDPKDLEDFFFQLLNRGKSTLSVAYKVRNSYELKNILGQLENIGVNQQ